MASHKYECMGTLPLEFTDGQQVECGEQFVRDFDATSGTEHEAWLTRLGIIRRVDEPIPSTPMRVVQPSVNSSEQD